MEEDLPLSFKNIYQWMKTVKNYKGNDDIVRDCFWELLELHVERIYAEYTADQKQIAALKARVADLERAAAPGSLPANTRGVASSVAASVDSVPTHKGPVGPAIPGEKEDSGLGGNAGGVAATPTPKGAVGPAIPGEKEDSGLVGNAGGAASSVVASVAASVAASVDSVPTHKGPVGPAIPGEKEDSGLGGNAGGVAATPTPKGAVGSAIPGEKEDSGLVGNAGGAASSVEASVAASVDSVPTHKGPVGPAIPGGKEDSGSSSGLDNSSSGATNLGPTMPPPRARLIASSILGRPPDSPAATHDDGGDRSAKRARTMTLVPLPPALPTTAPSLIAPTAPPLPSQLCTGCGGPLWGHVRGEEHGKCVGNCMICGQPVQTHDTGGTTGLLSGTRCPK